MTSEQQKLSGVECRNALIDLIDKNYFEASGSKFLRAS